MPFEGVRWDLLAAAKKEPSGAVSGELHAAQGLEGGTL